MDGKGAPSSGICLQKGGGPFAFLAARHGEQFLGFPSGGGGGGCGARHAFKRKMVRFAMANLAAAPLFRPILVRGNGRYAADLFFLGSFWMAARRPQNLFPPPGSSRSGGDGGSKAAPLESIFPTFCCVERLLWLNFSPP